MEEVVFPRWLRESVEQQSPEGSSDLKNFLVHFTSLWNQTWKSSNQQAAPWASKADLNFVTSGRSLGGLEARVKRGLFFWRSQGTDSQLMETIPGKSGKGVDEDS